VKNAPNTHWAGVKLCWKSIGKDRCGFSERRHRLGDVDKFSEGVLRAHLGYARLYKFIKNSENLDKSFE